MNEIYISVSKKEEDMLKFLGRVGFFITDFTDKLGFSKHIVYSLIKKDLIYKEKSMFIYTKLQMPYCLTNKGKTLVKSRYLINPYRFRMSQAEHDFVLANVYLSLNEEDRERWITETSLGIKYPEENVTDAMYISSANESVAVEVFTNNYSEGAKELKRLFIDRHCDKSIVIDANKF